ncbi:MAG: acyclic terpene utilization AtuA family protein, partial [Gemmatales bacterium]|nr:DUF1446 domain-containing protein [Gemmatales bacterium]MDW8175249.1 acyclic terpene utilization AtuA family protein [Gemmatales bacterium]
VGNGCGFWGDQPDAPVYLVERGDLDFLTLEYLAELTMSILAQQRQRDPQLGYATDFLEVLSRLCPLWQRYTKLRIITNAGGLNPLSCAERAREILGRHGLKKRVAIVRGDDLLPHLDDLLAAGHPLAHMDTGEPLTTVRPRVVSANVYLGAKPIVEALDQGADLVITGRVADASLTVAPAVWTFGWSWQDWDRLAAATIAGHLIECGAQVTGGLFTDWPLVPNLADVGYPIAELESDGTFRILKPRDSGGMVTIDTVREQLLYEVGDPAAYITPDVVADFTSVQLAPLEPDGVEVRHARGKPATETYKVSAAYRDGYFCSGQIVLTGRDAVEKARLCADMIRQRLRRAGAEPAQYYAEFLGAGDTVPGVWPRVSPYEIVLRITAWDSQRALLERFAREIAPLVTSGPPGVTGYATGRPPVREVFAYWPALLDKSAVKTEILYWDT